MGKISLEVRPWLSDVLGAKSPEPLVMQREVPAGTTIGDVLRKLTAEHQAFGEVLFDSQTRQLRGNICLVINGQLLRPPTELDASLKDGDTIMLLPFLDGG
ncbi:MAG: MoaD/ThiS family protein [Chloroflexota bacterium]